jgi:hypothetical protein
MLDFYLVQDAYNELLASGNITVVPAGPNQDNIINEQKAYLTRRAAWYLYKLDPMYGLLSKTTGTNVQGLSTDIVIRKNGDYYDIATDGPVTGGVKVTPVNSGASHDASLVPFWVQPTKELAGLNGEVEPPIPPSDIEAELASIQSGITAILATVATIKNNQITTGQLMESYHTQVMANLVEILEKPVKFPQYTGKLGMSMTFSPKV